VDDNNFNTDAGNIYWGTEQFLSYSVGKTEREGPHGRRGNKWESNTLIYITERGSAVLIKIIWLRNDAKTS
jgi:hypothetical protein